MQYKIEMKTVDDGWQQLWIEGKLRFQTSQPLDPTSYELIDVGYMCGRHDCYMELKEQIHDLHLQIDDLKRGSRWELVTEAAKALLCCTVTVGVIFAFVQWLA